MKQTLINQHSDINFHDAKINRVYISGENMIWELTDLQSTVSHSKTDTGIQKYGIGNCEVDGYWIKNVQIILENANIENMIIGGYEKYNNEGVLTEKKESLFAAPDKHSTLLMEISHENSSYIYGIKDLPAADGKYRISVMTNYELIIAFAKSFITWDE